MVAGSAASYTPLTIRKKRDSTLQIQIILILKAYNVKQMKAIFI